MLATFQLHILLPVGYVYKKEVFCALQRTNACRDDLMLALSEIVFLSKYLMCTYINLPGNALADFFSRMDYYYFFFYSVYYNT